MNQFIDMNSSTGNTPGGTNNLYKLVLNIFLIVGFCVFVAGVIWGVYSYNFRKNAVEVEANITNIESYYNSRSHKKEHMVYVDYEYEGKAYYDRYLGYYNSNMHIGETITILCNPDNPDKIQSKSMGYLGPMIMIPIGIVFIAIGIFARKFFKGNNTASYINLYKR